VLNIHQELLLLLIFCISQGSVVTYLRCDVRSALLQIYRWVQQWKFFIISQ